MSRTEDRIRNNLGIIPGNQVGKIQKVRCTKLDKYDQYLESKQYDKLLDWDAGNGPDDDYVAIRKRKPRVIYNLPSRIVNTVTSKLVGDNVFPRIKVDDDPATTDFLRVMQETTSFRHRLIPVVRRMLASGSSFCRFYIVGSKYKLSTYNAKYCYPKFNDEGDLDEIEIRYTYFDPEDKDDRGRAKEKWYRLHLGRDMDTLFDNPEYVEGTEPVFEVANQVAHKMGFVQGVWFRTGEDRHNPDGPSLLCDALDFFDAINYSLSQGDQAVNYAQEPQLGISGMDVDEIGELVKSSAKAWNLGRDGKAAFIEADLGGVQRGMELRDKMFQGVQNVARVVMLDPEKIVGSAQSAKAMEVLHGPLVDLVNEMRPQVAEGMKLLLTKMAITLLVVNRTGQNQVMTIPPMYQPQSMNITLSWPPVFPMTMQDLQQKVSVASAVSGASLISRETLTQWLAKDFGVEDIDEEIRKINAQPVLNPFSMF